tara:strand:- start:96 stop:1823 length:1728 start_codon:yes stop_codon:yes gene_type:complete
MAETLISPGVLARENDSSFVSKRPVVVGAAIIGPTVKGPVEVPTIITTYSDFVNKFGTTIESGSVNDKKTYTYFTSITAYNYFLNGGTSLLVCRVVSGSYTSATSSLIPTGSGGPTTGLSPFVLQTFSKGTIMNSDGPEVSGSLSSGSVDNLRWQIVNSNSSSGTFDLLIRQGNDNPLQPIILSGETWTGLTLDPNSPNYVARVIGDINENYSLANNQIQYSGSFSNRSNYVRVSAVNYTTTNYFDNNGVAKNQYTGSIPVNASGAFGGAAGTIKGGANFYSNINSGNTQGIVAANYDNMINLLSNMDDYKFNMLLTPGLYDADYPSQVSNIITNTQNRGDNIYVLDPVAYGKNVSTVTGQAAARNTSYAAEYWPWLQVIDPSTGELVWVPASTMIGGVYAYNDSVAEPWFAPAGINRGGLSPVVRAEQRLSQTQRDTLYTGKVNPIATFPGTGVVVYGQKTLQTRASALDRVNVRRLLISLKSYISQIANTLVFEQNTAATRNNFLAQVNPYLSSVQQRQGLYAFKVIMDDSNNTPDVIDRNELVGQIYLQPTKTAEFIYLDFNITPTGASFPA